MRADSGRRASLALLASVAGALAAYAAGSVPVRLVPGTSAWSRLVRGAPDDRLLASAFVDLPGLSRSQPTLVTIEAAEGGALEVTTGGGWTTVAARPGAPVVVSVPAARAPGARLGLRPAPGADPPRLAAVALPAQRRALARAVVAGLSALATVLLLRRDPPALALGVGLVVAGMCALASAPRLLFLTLPASPALLRLALPLALLAAGALAGRGHARFARLAALAAAFVLGAWVRVFFLPSTGSWDTEYWKAWMARAADHGVARVYGDADAVPPGRFWPQLSGREPLWQARFAGRDFVVDYPPGAMALWRASWALAPTLAPGMDRLEAQSVAVKLPAVLGDVGAVAVLLWALRREPARAATLAALYWALPVSWLSSAVLGFLDGAYAPLLALAVVAAGEGRGIAAGAGLAASSLVKPIALVAAPAVAVALRAARGSLARATAAGAGLVLAALAPFALAGTLATAVVHVARILFQERLSGGYPNLWWVAGHLATLDEPGRSLAGRVPFARLEAVPLPAGITGTVAFLALTALVARGVRRAPGARPAALAAAALVLAYGMVAVGVHENHVHPAFLLLALTGLRSPRLAALAGGLALVYVANMLLLSGLGRFHGLRYMRVEELGAALLQGRMALGFDATLALALLNAALLAALLAGLGRELRTLAGEPAPR